MPTIDPFLYTDPRSVDRSVNATMAHRANPDLGFNQFLKDEGLYMDVPTHGIPDPPVQPSTPSVETSASAPSADFNLMRQIGSAAPLRQLRTVVPALKGLARTSGVLTGITLTLSETLSIGTDLVTGQNPFETTGAFERFGRVLGGVGGSIGGTLGGGTVGTLVTANPAGTIYGAAIGSGIGTEAGYQLGGWLGRQLDNLFSRPDNPYSQWSAERVQTEYLIEQALAGEISIDELERGLSPILSDAQMTELIGDLAEQVESLTDPNNQSDPTDPPETVERPDRNDYAPPVDNPPTEPGYYTAHVDYIAYRWLVGTEYQSIPGTWSASTLKNPSVRIDPSQVLNASLSPLPVVEFLSEGQVVAFRTGYSRGSYTNPFTGSQVIGHTYSVPVAIRYDYIGPLEAEPPDPTPNLDCRAPDLIPAMEAKIDSSAAEIAKLQQELASTNAQIQALEGALVAQLSTLRELVQTNSESIFDAIKEVNNEKTIAADELRKNQIISAVNENTNAKTAAAAITAADNHNASTLLQGQILENLGLAKADILANENISINSVLAGIETAQTNLANQATTNASSIIDAVNNLEPTVDLSSLPTTADLTNALNAQTTALRGDNADQTSAIIGAIQTPELGPIEVKFPEDYVRQTDLDTQTDAINAHTDSAVTPISTTVESVSERIGDPEDIPAQLPELGELMRNLAIPLTVLGSAAALGVVIYNNKTVITSNMTTVLARLGPQVEGGISTSLSRFRAFTEKAWEKTRLGKVLDALTLVAALHNAAMLSRNLGETLGELTSQILDVIGIEDENGSPIDINGILGDTIEKTIKAVVGEQVYNGVSAAWNKASRILSSASQIVWTIRSIMDSTTEILEWTAENTGRIGNALKKWGVVGPRSYPWMAEKINAQSRWRRRFDGFIQGTEALDDAAASLGTVVGEVQNIQQEVEEIQAQKQRFADHVRDAIPDSPLDNEFVQATEDAAKAVSVSPDIANTDMTVGQ